MNKYLIAIGLFVAGGLTTYFILPAKIETVIETKIVEKQVDRHVDVVTKKTTKNDGTIVEEKHIVSDTKTVEDTKENKYRKTETNPKRLLVYVGKDPLTQRAYIGGFSYQLWGPLDVGAQYSVLNKKFYITVGIRF